MQLRHLRYFATLARVRHFAKAAEECGISQPTLSAGLQALELEFGRRLVERDRRFVGLTEQGMAMLPWAAQILGAIENMTDAVAATVAPLKGEFRLAAIPAALPLVGPFGETLMQQYPGVSMSIHSATSREIERGLHALEFDVGLTYLDDEGLDNMLSVALESEKYIFVTRQEGVIANRESISWLEAASHPVCLLHQGMQYRRILDASLAERGLALNPCVVADSFIALFALVQTGAFATIVPGGYARMLAGLEWARFLPFDEGEVVRRIGLVTVNREPMGPLASAGLAVARMLVNVDRYPTN